MSLEVYGKRIRSVAELEVEDRQVFCRVDLNVPLEGQAVSDDTRIRAILPTLTYLLDHNARVVLASHLGRPKGKPVPKYSLLPVAEHLSRLVQREVLLPDDCIGDGVRKLLQEARSGSIVLLENLRFHPEEEANQEAFARSLAKGMDVYVNDAFGTLHRAHASTSALPSLMGERGAGLLVEKELSFLTPLVENPAHPYAVILGGAKISDKIKILENLLRRIDRLFLGGAMVFTFLKALGHRVGHSLVEDSMLNQAKRILAQAEQNDVMVFWPKDFQLARSMEDGSENRIVEGLDIPEGWMGLDVGPRTIEYFLQSLGDVRTLFWNGPLGLFEKPPFDQGTLQLARGLGNLSMTRVIGGGDSAAAVAKAGVSDTMSHISTGGGATLEFLEGEPLPGLRALAV